eukprot:2266573-Pyramimonas_sp.AAC.1
MVEFREQNFQPTKSHQKVSREFSCELALQRPGITLKLPATSKRKLYELLGSPKPGQRHRPWRRETGAGGEPST